MAMFVAIRTFIGVARAKYCAQKVHVFLCAALVMAVAMFDFTAA